MPEKTYIVRTHDDPPEEYEVSKDHPPLIVEALRLEGVFPPNGCVKVGLRQHESGAPVLVYEVMLSDEDWAKARRAFEAAGKEQA